MPKKAKPEPIVYGGKIPYSDVTGELDPHKVYVSRALSLASKAKPGLERFAYRVFGPQFIGSLAFALDPWSAYKFPTMKITPANRTTKLQVIPFQTRAIQDSTVTKTCFSQQDPTFKCGVSSTTGAAGVRCSSTTNNGPIAAQTPQLGITGIRKDSTVRTRAIGSKGGEFELFIPTLSVPARFSSSTDGTSVTYFSNTDCLLQRSETIYDRSSQSFGPALRIEPSSYTAFLTGEQTRFVQLGQKYALGMVGESLPASRRFSLYRDVAELKDLPLMLRRTVELAKDVSTLLELKGQGNQYLNYKFGWEATVRAVVDMLKVPEKIANQVNYLIDRNGLSTTFAATRSGSEQWTGVDPTLFMEQYAGEFGQTWGYGTRMRNWRLRSVINYGVRFPKVDVPQLRQDLLDVKWGVNPQPQDVFNLVPWTWLVDWFGGLGEYIEVMNTLANDRSLFNYGYLTYKAEVKMPFVHTWKRTTGVGYNVDGTWSGSSYDKVSTWQCNIGYRYHRRIDISTLSGMKAVSRPGSLSGGQLAIIGALLTKWASN
jgi:hypothetical protein